MKKLTFIFAALAAAFAVSCVKETPVTDVDTPVEVGMKTVTITANIADVDTKTSYDADGKFSWTKGDQISVLGTDTKLYTFTATKTGSTTSFTGVIPADCGLGDYAMYPADPKHRRGSTSLKFYIPEYKDLTSEVTAELPMIGDKGDGDVYSFVHCSGADLFTIENIPNGIESVEIAFTNSDLKGLKFSGEFSVTVQDKLPAERKWSAAGWESETSEPSEANFIRKVKVVDNVAKLYFPYATGSQMWADRVLDVTGFDAEGTSVELVIDKKVKAHGRFYERAVVYPAVPLVLSNLNNIDWDTENVHVYDLPAKASSSRQALRQVKVVSDKYYVYARLVASAEKLTSTSSDYFGLFIYDVTDGSGDGYYGWNNSAAGNTEYNGEHAGILNLADYTMTLSVNGTAVDVTTAVSGDEIIWMMAIPRSSDPSLVASGSAYFTFLTYAGWTPTGSVPEKYDSMLEVTLP